MAAFEPQPELSRCNSFISSPSALSDAEVESCCQLYATQTNSRLLHVLSDLVKAFLDTENDIQKALDGMGFSQSETSPSPRDREEILPSLEEVIERLSCPETNGNDLCEDGPELITPSSTFCTSLTLNPNGVGVSNLSAGNAEDDILLGASRRLRSAVKRIVHLLQEIVSSHQQQESLLSKVEDACRESNPETEDLKAQLESTSKQISSFQRFIEDQGKEREYEREQFNVEVNKLEEKMREKEKTETKLRDELESHENQVAALLEEKKDMENKLFELSRNLKRSLASTEECKQLIAQLEKDNEEHVKTEKKLKRKISEMQKTMDLQAHLHDEIHREQLQNSSSLANAVIENINMRTSQLQRTLNMGEILDMTDFSVSLAVSKPDVNYNSTSNEDSSVECSYADVNVLDEKMKLLNACIDKLVAQNLKLKSDLDYTNANLKNAEDKFSELLQEKVRLENQVREVKREEEVLQEELNNKRLQLSALKSRTESTMGQDPLHLKQITEDLKKSLSREQNKNDNLKQQVAQLSLLNEERNGTIQRLTEEIKIISAAVASVKTKFKKVEMDKDRLSQREDELLGINENLLLQESLLKKEIDKLTRHNQDLTNQLHHITVQQNEVVLPQLLQKVIKDKNEEIKCLSQKLMDLENKLLCVFPDADSHDVVVLVDHLIEKTQSKKKVKLQNSVSPKRSSLVSASTNSEQDIQEANQLEECKEYIKQLTKALNECQSENELLKHKNQILQASNAQSFHNAVGQRSLSHESLNDDTDLEEENLQDALQTLHNNSRELLLLSESRKTHSNSILRQVIESLPFAVLGDLSDEHEGPGFEWKKQFLDNFPCQEIGKLLFEKLQQINYVHNECSTKMKHYYNQYECVKARLGHVEQELSEIQSRLVSYQQAYEKLKEKCKLYEAKTKEGDVNQTELEEKLMSYRANYKAAKEEIQKLELELMQTHTGSLRNGGDEDLYANYKRCLSHKNALIYQKKYLLSVLGGFQLTEKATLALLANMNVTMEESHSSWIKSPYSKFRTGVFAVISILRMKFLVKRNLLRSNSNSKASFKIPAPVPRIVHKTCMESSISSISSSKSETNATLQEFVTRLHNLHQTLGIRPEARVQRIYSSEEELCSRINSRNFNGF